MGNSSICTILIKYLEDNKELIEKGTPYFFTLRTSDVSGLFKVLRKIDKTEINNAKEQAPELINNWHEYLLKAIRTAPKEISNNYREYAPEDRKVIVDDYEKIVFEKLGRSPAQLAEIGEEMKEIPKRRKVLDKTNEIGEEMKEIPKKREVLDKKPMK